MTFIGISGSEAPIHSAPMWLFVCIHLSIVCVTNEEEVGVGQFFQQSH